MMLLDNIVALVVGVVTAKQLDPALLLLGLELSKLGQSLAEARAKGTLLGRLLQIFGALPLLVGGVELSLVLLEVLEDLLPLGLGEKLLPRTPGELVEVFKALLVQLLALEGPENVSVVHGKLEVSAANGLRDDGSDSSSRGVPKYVVSTVMLLDDQRLVVDVVKLESTTGRLAETGQDDVGTGWAPENCIALLASESLDLVDLGDLVRLGLADGLAQRVLVALVLLLAVALDLLHHVVERHVDLAGVGILGVDEGKARPGGLELEGHDGILDVDHFDGNAGLVETEQLEVVVQSLLGLGMSGDLDAEVLPVVLPHHAALGNVEEVLLAELLAGGQLDEVDVGGGVAYLGSPVGDDVLLGTELEFVDAVGDERSLVEKLHAGSLVDGDEVLAHSGQVLVVVGPLEGGGRYLVHGGTLGQKVLGIKGEGTQELAGLDGEDLDGVGIVATVVAGQQVLLLRREDDGVDAGSGEAGNLLEAISAPQNHALVGDEGGQIRSVGRPPGVVLAPRHPGLLLPLSVVVDDGLRLAIAPLDDGLPPLAEDELVALDGILEPRAGVGPLPEGFGLRLFKVGRRRYLFEVLGAVVRDDREGVVLVELFVLWFAGRGGDEKKVRLWSAGSFVTWSLEHALCFNHFKHIKRMKKGV